MQIILVQGNTNEFLSLDKPRATASLHLWKHDPKYYILLLYNSFVSVSKFILAFLIVFVYIYIRTLATSWEELTHWKRL